MSQSYMDIALECALDEAGVAVTPQQFKDIAESLAISAENEGLATGRDCIPNPLQAEVDRATRNGKDAVERAEADGAKALKAKDDHINRLLNRIYDLERKLRDAA